MAKKPFHPADPAVADRLRGAFAGDGLRKRMKAPTRSTAQPRGPPDDDDDAFDAYSIASFCKRHGISQALYFKLCGMGLGPRTMKCGRRVLISKAAAEEWRLAREADAAAKRERATV